MKLLIVSKQNPKCLAAARKLISAFKKSHSVLVDETTGKKLNLPHQKIEDFRGNLIITLGGDGTFIYASHKARVPILPVRIEGFGYLTTIDFQKLLKNPGIIKKGKIITRSRLFVKGDGEYHQAVNEIAFVKDVPSKIIKIKFEIDDVCFEYKGDGILFSTPAGSTAYALSAGGSVFNESIQAFEMVPILPFNSRLKPMLIPNSKKVIVHAESCMMIIDGLKEKKIQKENVTIKKGNPIKILAFNENFFEKYREKFLG